MAWYKRSAFYGSVKFRGSLYTAPDSRQPHGPVYFMADSAAADSTPEVLYLYDAPATSGKLLGAVRPDHRTLRGMDMDAKAERVSA